MHSIVSMKKHLEKVLIAVAILGSLIRVLDIDYSVEVFLFTTSSLALYYAFIGRFDNSLSTILSGKTMLFLIRAGRISLSIIIMGYIFKTMHWPTYQTILFAGLVGIGIASIAILVNYQKIEPGFRRLELSRFLIGAVMGLLILVLSL